MNAIQVRRHCCHEVVTNRTWSITARQLQPILTVCLAVYTLPSLGSFPVDEPPRDTHQSQDNATAAMDLLGDAEAADNEPHTKSRELCIYFAQFMWWMAVTGWLSSTSTSRDRPCLSHLDDCLNDCLCPTRPCVNSLRV